METNYPATLSVSLQNQEYQIHEEIFPDFASGWWFLWFLELYVFIFCTLYRIIICPSYKYPLALATNDISKDQSYVTSRVSLSPVSLSIAINSS